jgi:1,4-dihydroxy-2-naphthoate octaprenyltransferase
MSNKIRGVLGVSRAPFLPLAGLLALSGSVTQGGSSLNWINAVVAAIGLIAAHILVNVLNELSDDKTGVDHHTVRTPFSGGSGALQSGDLTREEAWMVAIVSGVIALAVAYYFVVTQGRTSLVPVVLGGIGCIVFYTPWLLRLGVGEIAAGAGLGLLPVLGAAITQNDEPFTSATWIISLAAGLMTFNLLLLNTIPDMEPDRMAGRRSLVVRFGVSAAGKIALAAAVAAVLLIVVGVVIRAVPLFSLAAVVVAAPLLLSLSQWLKGGAALPIPNKVLGANVVHNLATHLVIIIAFTLGKNLF